MERALVQAGRGAARTWPNPCVGAVLFRGDEILGEGFTRPPGGAHAEIVALAAARRRHGPDVSRGASMAVTLEPCSHQGRTGPCAVALAEAGVERVYVGHRDPHQAVRGRGLAILRRAGVAVAVGVLREACLHQNRGFLTHLASGRPRVALKLAASIDGRIATRRGESRWITGKAARALVHELRAGFDALAVGSGTARADDPLLTVRRPGRKERAPVRVLFDASLAVPARARLFQDAHAASTWLLTRRGHAAAAQRSRTARGARWLEVARRGAHLDLAKAISRLGSEGLTSLWVEGGGGLAAALLRAGLVDEVHWFSAPSLLGGDARAAIGALGIRRLDERVALEVQEVRQIGPDLYVQARLEGRVEGEAWL
jgi:diaminohydroxyphosphoribosylaminopyrimidine deaminase/5-amino-6-(5-phosphoribosylamino)uracil reductase